MLTSESLYINSISLLKNCVDRINSYMTLLFSWTVWQSSSIKEYLWRADSVEIAFSKIGEKYLHKEIMKNYFSSLSMFWALNSGVSFS